MFRATALSGALVASQCVLAGSDRNLVQCASAQTLATQSLSQHEGPRTLSQRVHRLSQPGCQTDQVDLYRREARTETRKSFMIACTKYTRCFKSFHAFQAVWWRTGAPDALLVLLGQT